MNLNGKTTNPGEMRTSIILESVTINKDAGGAQKPAYATVATVWARWINAHGPESVTDNALQGLKQATVLIRYRTDITAAWAITKGGERYKIITPPDDVRDRHEYLEMQVQLLKVSA